MALLQKVFSGKLVTSNVNKFLAGIDRFGKEMEGGWLKLMNEILIKIEREVRINAPVGHYATVKRGGKGNQGGALRRSITSGITKVTRGYIEGQVGAGQFYAIYVEMGTGIYYEAPKRGGGWEPAAGFTKGSGAMIRPKQGKYLTFQLASGKWIKARYIKGQRPRHFMYGAFMKLYPELLTGLNALTERTAAIAMADTYETW